MRRWVAALFGAAFVASVVVSPSLTATASPRVTEHAGESLSTAVPDAPPMIAVPHPLIVPDVTPGSRLAPQSATADGSATPPAPSASAANAGSITGEIDWRAMQVAADPFAVGATVTAYQFGTDGSSKVLGSAVTSTGGIFTLSNLAAGAYYLDIADSHDWPDPMHEWYGATALNPYGTTVTVVPGTVTQIWWDLDKPIPISGHVTCEQCSSLPASGDLTIVFAVRDQKLYDWVGVAKTHPAADGSYAFTATAPWDYGFAIFAEYSGADNLAPVAMSPTFPQTDWRLAQVQDVFIPRVVAPHDFFLDVVPTVHALYWDFLHRSPTESDVEFWGDRIADYGNGPDVGQVTASFANSDEYRLIRIDEAYRTVLGRDAEPGGRLSWLHGMQIGLLTPDDALTSFYASDEYFQNHGGTNASYAAALYQALLGRSGTASDYAFWGKLVAEHGRPWVISQFWDSTETVGVRVTGMFQLYLDRPPNGAELSTWSGNALRIGDSGVRAAITASAEYRSRADTRYVRGK